MPEWLRWPQWLTRRRAVPLGLVLYLLLRLRLLRLRAGAAAAALAPVIYSSFLGQVQAGEVTKVLLGPATLTFTTAAGAFLTDRFSDETLLPLLLKHKVTFGLAPVARMKKIGPMLVLLVPFIYLGMAAYMMAGIGKGPKGKPVGKRQDRRSPKSSVHFADAGGVDSAKAELMDIVSFIRSPGKYESLGALMPKGALLVGPSGTGKTLLARAVAGECNLPFFSCSASDFVEVYVGLGASRIRQLFNDARAAKPAIVFIDEIDAVGAIRSEGGRAGGANDEREQTLNALLTELDGFEPGEGVILLAATNRPQMLDPALTRPGRIDRKVSVPLPDEAGRHAILRLHATRLKADAAQGSEADPLGLAEVAKCTPGRSGADLANLLNESAMLAVRSGDTMVRECHLRDALEKDTESRELLKTRQQGQASGSSGTDAAGGMDPALLQFLQMMGSMPPPRR